MTTASHRASCRLPRSKGRFWKSGFSLVEVVVATGLCTYALVVIACLLPMGLGTVQAANGQVVQTEIFNKIWLEVNSTPFYDLPTYSRLGKTTLFSGTAYGTYPDSTQNTTGLSYFDKDGGEIGGTTAQATPPASAIYYVYCTLVNSYTKSTQSALSPPVDGAGSVDFPAPYTPTASSSPPTGGAGLNFIKIQIGFHVDPSNPTLSTTDTRVVTRTYLIAKRDTTNGN